MTLLCRNWLVEVEDDMTAPKPARTLMKDLRNQHNCSRIMHRYYSKTGKGFLYQNWQFLNSLNYQFSRIK